MQKRLFIVANRLPVNILAVDNAIEIRQSSGGLVSAINSYLQQQANKDFEEIFWVGIPCCEPADWDTAKAALDRSYYEYIPVYLNEKLYNQYYNGFSNSAVWPLFHYFPSYTEYDRTNYSSYMQANAAFAETLQKHLRPNDVVWIHDYHLLPLADMIRQKFPDITIGFFLHIPFPSYEVFRLLPKQWQYELLTGMMGADLIGFHTIDYATHFLKTVQMVLGYENDLNIMRYRNRLVKADVFPISIDFEKFNNAWDDNKVVELRNQLLQKFPGKQIIFSVDRLDYTKGVEHRLEGFRYFLQQNGEYKEKVVFVMVIVPSREYIPRYAERKKMIDELISNINSKIGTIHWQPVIYQYNSLSFEEMLALYTACDMALITPLRDGMNLVAKEFAASRKDKKGVLLLSEMAGAARELTTALHINPNDVIDVAEKIRVGLLMDVAEQCSRMEVMQKRISQYNVATWANDFITQLYQAKTRQQEFQIKFIDDADKRFLFSLYRNAAKRLFLLDYDGTLAPFSSAPDSTIPGKGLKNILNCLAADPCNDIYIISGRSSKVLDEWFANIPIHLIAEHGAKMRNSNGQWSILVSAQHDWKPAVMATMEQYVKRCANTFIEEKEFCISWHYRDANPEQAKLRARELFNEIHEYSGQLGVQLLMGNKIVEVKVNGANKGLVVKNHILHYNYDLVFAAGDDKTDEDMFRQLISNENAYTIKVGPEASYAKYNLLTPQMVVALLNNLVNITSLPAGAMQQLSSKATSVI
jgi:trehalose 6-phosphate synthase/phosphatase